MLGYAPEAHGPLPAALYRLLDPNLSVDLPPAHKVLHACSALVSLRYVMFVGGALCTWDAHICCTLSQPRNFCRVSRPACLVL